MSYLNMVLTEFLKKISGENDIWELSIGDESYSLKQTELTDLKEKDIRNLKANGAKFTFLERNNDLTEIEILDYLAKITNNFDTQRSQIVLKDIEDFQFRFIGDSEYQSLFIYKVNGWRIPIKSIEKIDKCDVETYDYDWMLSPTHGVGIRNIEKVISVLKNEMEKKETESQQAPDVKEQPENPHPRIFKESIHFQLFDYLRRNIDKNQLAEFSFIYWQMIKDGFIYEGVKPTEYINWLSVTYQIDLIELKQYHNCNTGNKLTLYQTAKRLFQC